MNRGAGYEEKFFTFGFLPARRHDPLLSGPEPPVDESEPDETVLLAIYRGELVKRLPKVE